MLTVRESQNAVFVNEGTIADVFPPGLYKLETANLPILTTLQSWPHGFSSPFKAEVYFLSTRQFVDLKWGTKNPIMMRDSEFGAVRLRGFGTYAIRITDPARFLKEVAGTDHYFTTDEITDQLRNLIVSRFAEIVAQSEISILDLAANYDDLGQFLQNRINPEFDAYGLALTSLLVENISLPGEVEKALDRRTSMGMVGDLRKYTEFQAAEALGKAAENQGTGGSAMAMGVGFAMSDRLGRALEPQPRTDIHEPPPIPADPQYYIVVDGKRAGPYEPAELAGQVENGTLTSDTLVWRGGMRKWRRAAELEEVTDILRLMPPPLPEGE
jgi:membrane protease subunit (stomatin/prohibitin family)